MKNYEGMAGAAGKWIAGVCIAGNEDHCMHVQWLHDEPEHVAKVLEFHGGESKKKHE